MEGMGEEKLYFLLLKSVNVKKAQLEQSVSTHFVADICGSGLQANFTGMVTLSPDLTSPALLTRFILCDICCNIQDLQENLKFSMENTLTSRKNGKILSLRGVHLVSEIREFSIYYIEFSG